MVSPGPIVAEAHPRRHTWAGHRLVLVADTLGALLVVGATVVVFPSLRSGWYEAAPNGMMLGLCWLGVVVLLGEGRAHPRRSSGQQLTATLQAVAGGTGLAVVLETLLPNDGVFTPLQYGAASVLAVALLWPAHRASSALAARHLKEKYLVVSNNGAADALVEATRAQEVRDYCEIVGIVTQDITVHRPDIPVFHCGLHWAAVPALAHTLGANRIVLDADCALSTEARGAVQKCRQRGARVLGAASAYEALAGKTPLGELEVTLRPSQHRVAAGAYHRYGKRAVDIVLASLLLPVAALVIGGAAVVMKIFMPGPIFYHQERVGCRGRSFRLTKLRTMIPDAEKDTGPVWCAKQDARVPPLGRILRKTKIDELPQLLHVLTGQMSLIGPRPERPHFVQQLSEKLPSYGQRLAVRPGITGWAQVRHHYDTCFEDVCEKLRYDLYYIRHVSWAFDLDILRRTVGVVLRDSRRAS